MCRYSKCTCSVRIFWRSEVVNHRTTDNVMAKWKGQLKQTMIYKTLHRKLKIEQKKTTINLESTQVLQNCTGTVQSLWLSNLSDKRTYPKKNITDTKNNIYNILSRKVWRYQRGNQKQQIEGQTIQCTKDKKENNDLQNRTKKAKDWATNTNHTKNRGWTQVLRQG